MYITRCIRCGRYLSSTLPVPEYVRQERYDDMPLIIRRLVAHRTASPPLFCFPSVRPSTHINTALLHKLQKEKNAESLRKNPITSPKKGRVNTDASQQYAHMPSPVSCIESKTRHHPHRSLYSEVRAGNSIPQHPDRMSLCGPEKKCNKNHYA